MITHKNIPGWFDTDSEKFYAMMLDMFPDGSHFVEIGCYKGQSACFMAQRIKKYHRNIKFDCIDHFLGSPEHQEELKDKNLYSIFMQNMFDANVMDVVRVLPIESDRAVQLYDDRSVDFVFIDADHSYEAVKNDIMKWLPKVKLTGVISGDDHVSQHPGVIKAVNEIFGNKIKLINNRFWYVEVNKVETKITKRNIVLKTWKTTNWGDFINEELVKLLSGITPDVIEAKYVPKETNYLVVGSIVHFADDNSVIWGAGVLDEKTDLHGKKPKVLAVRGPKSREIILRNNVECPEIYGDPVLLFPRYYKPKIEKKYKLGIIAHWQDTFNKIVHSFKPTSKITVIRTQNISAYEFIDRILECEKIASSSLHGLVVADAYGIPSLRIVIDNLNGDFKYDDYFMSIDRPLHHFKIEEQINTEKILRQDFWSGSINVDKLLDACPFRKN